MRTQTRFMLDFARRFLSDQEGTLPAQNLRGTHIAPTIPDPDPGESANIQIVLVRGDPESVAPSPRFLRCDPSNMGVSVQPDRTPLYDPATHLLEYKWEIQNLDDAGWAAETYDYVGDLPAEFQVKGERWGRKIGVMLDAPAPTLGYRTRCTVIRESDGYSETSAWFSLGTVADPDDHFADNETIYVAPVGETGDAPTPNAGVYTDLGSARQRIEANPAGTGRYRVRVKRGFTYSQGFSCPQDGNTCITWMLDDWGSGAKPILTGNIRTGRANGQASVTSWRIRNVDVVRSVAGETIDLGYQDNNRVGAIWNVRCEGVPTEATSAPYAVISPGDGTGWIVMANSQFLKLSGLWALRNIGNAVCVVGCVYEDDPNGPASHAKPDAKREGYGLRWGGDAWLTSFSQCRFFKKTGWFDNATSIQTTHQIFRIGNSDRAGQCAHIERCLMEGSWKVVNLTEGDGALGNVIVERNLMYGVHDTNGAVASKFSGYTIRNNLFVRPPSQPAQGATSSLFLLNQFSGFSGTLTVDEAAAPSRVYSNTIIVLGDVASDFAVAEAGGSGLTALTEANNVLHMPYSTSVSPVDAGPFTLTALYDTLYKGYFDTETPTGNITQTAEYLVSGSSRVGTFIPGETVVGSVSGSSRVFRRFNPDFDDKMAFETPLINTGPITTNRFVAGETLTGQTSGATAIVGNTVQQGTLDTGLYDTLLIPRTVTPTHVIAYDGETGAFTEGETLSGGTSGATAYICQVMDNGTTGLLWLRDVVGTFQDNEALTDGDTGAATANGAATISGVGALWVQNTLTDVTAGPCAATDFFGDARPATLTSRHQGAFEGAI